MLPSRASPVVIDTCVLLAGLYSTRGAAYRVLELIGSGQFEIALSVPLVLEYQEKLSIWQHRLGLTELQIADLLDYYCRVARRVTIHFLCRPFLPDRDDDLVLEVAAAAEAAHIITHNERHFRGADAFGIQVVTPIEYLSLIGLRR